MSLTFLCWNARCYRVDNQPQIIRKVNLMSGEFIMLSNRINHKIILVEGAF